MTGCTVERGLIPIAKRKSIEDLGEGVVTGKFPLLDDGFKAVLLFLSVTRACDAYEKTDRR